MVDFGDGHPCAGKDCIECETCIFDRELFPDGITPNEEKKNKTSNIKILPLNKITDIIELINTYFF